MGFGQFDDRVPLGDKINPTQGQHAVGGLLTIDIKKLR